MNKSAKTVRTNFFGTLDTKKFVTKRGMLNQGKKKNQLNFNKKAFWHFLVPTPTPLFGSPEPAYILSKDGSTGVSKTNSIFKKLF